MPLLLLQLMAEMVEFMAEEQVVAQEQGAPQLLVQAVQVEMVL